ncbi:MAG: CotH kinase family protein [Pedosphaera sp.]|nr:CotH kinase family protein [Pedosphaera sp.]
MSRLSFVQIAIVPFLLLPCANIPVQADPFKVDRLLDVKVAMPAADWKKMRYEHHDLFGLITPRKPGKPRPNPYHYFKGNVTIGGKLFKNVGLRKKGLLGSVNAQRPSIKINFDKFGAEQEFEGVSLMTLNNNDTDASLVKQHLAYELFRKAGIPAPRCNFARVTVNGEYLGVYSHVESVRKDFLKRHFTKASGNLYEGQISDFTEKAAGTFDAKVNAKKNDRNDLLKATKALAVPDEQLFDAVGKVINLNDFYRYWAMEGLIGFNDGYSGNQNNFFIYNDPQSGRFKFIPWGADGVFRARSGKASQAGTPMSVMAEGVVAHRLYKTEKGRERYRSELLKVLDEVWDEQALQAKLDKLTRMLRSHTHLPPRLYDPAVDSVRRFISKRRNMLGVELTGPIPLWPKKMRSGPTSANSKSLTMKCTFNTKWTEAGDLSFENKIGQCIIELIHGDEPIEITDMRAHAALTQGTSRYGFPVISAVGRLSDSQQEVMVNLMVDPGFYKVSDSIPIDGFTIWGFVRMGRQGSAKFKRIGWAKGELKLTAASRNEGETVAGYFEASCNLFGKLNSKPKEN